MSHALIAGRLNEDALGFSIYPHPVKRQAPALGCREGHQPITGWRDHLWQRRLVPFST
jgi:hypothetical protein